MAKKTWNWGILGCGHIADKFAADLKFAGQAYLAAVASRSAAKASAFASRFGVARAYDSYEELASDPDLDIIYIATPHSHHHRHTLLCLDQHKAVLCEKAFALNSAQVSQMIDSARRNNAFLMEAFWTRFHPSFVEALRMIQSGELGRLRMVRADFGFRGNQDPQGRLYNLSLGGGSLLDVGIYPVFTALCALGVPETIQAMAIFAPTGADQTLAVNFKYADGSMASLSSSVAFWAPVQAEFWLEKGFIRLNRQFNAPTTLTVCREGGAEQLMNFPAVPGYGYTAEAEHVMDCLDKGLVESPVLPLSFSADLMSTLDRIRAAAGIVYPEAEAR